MVNGLPLLLAMAAVQSAAALQEIFTSGPSQNPWSMGVNSVYRIPSLVSTKAGALLAFTSERLGRANDDTPTNLVQRRSTDGGKTWSTMTRVVSTTVATGRMSSAPWAIADASSGDILLFFNGNSTKTEKCDCIVWSTRSSNDGMSWTKPVAAPRSSGLYGSSLNSGITISRGPHKGRLVTCMRAICKNSCPGPHWSFASYSDDHGTTWRSSPHLADGTTECQIAELSTGKLCEPRLLAPPRSLAHAYARSLPASNVSPLPPPQI
jgi:sialidase-1